MGRKEFGEQRPYFRLRCFVAFWVIFLHWNQAEIWKNYSVVQLYSFFIVYPYGKQCCLSALDFFIAYPLFFVFTPVENSEATWKKATKCNRKSWWRSEKYDLICNLLGISIDINLLLRAGLFFWQFWHCPEALHSSINKFSLLFGLFNFSILNSYVSSFSKGKWLSLFALWAHDVLIENS